MNLIYIHLNPNILNYTIKSKSEYTFDNIPSYFFDSLHQSRNVYKDNITTIIPNSDIIHNFAILEKYNVTMVDSNILIQKDNIQELIKQVQSTFPSYAGDTFWFLTFFRLIVLCQYIIDHNLEDVIHIENDNLIFYDIKELIKEYKEKCKDSVGYTHIGPYLSSSGIIYIENKIGAEKLLNYFKKIISKGESQIANCVGFYSKNISEMNILNVISEYDESIVKLPILPRNTQFVYDGASYGQYLGGTAQNETSGLQSAFKHHFVGNLLLKGEINALWENNKPIVINRSEQKAYPIFNLHVHCKNLKKFIFNNSKHNIEYNDIITGNKFKQISHNWLDEFNDVHMEFDPKNNIFFIKTDYLQHFYNNIIPRINYPFKLITHNSDLAIKENNIVMDILNNQYLIEWYAMNCHIVHPKLFNIPIGIANERFKHGNKEILIQTINKNIIKNNLVYCNFNVNTQKDRISILNYLHSLDFIHFRSNNLSYEDYLCDMAKHKYTISPPGNSIDCHRIWESIYLNVIPIVQNHIVFKHKHDLPILFINNWNEITEDLLNTKYDEIIHNSRKKAKFSFYNDIILI